MPPPPITAEPGVRVAHTGIKELKKQQLLPLNHHLLQEGQDQEVGEVKIEDTGESVSLDNYIQYKTQHCQLHS